MFEMSKYIYTNEPECKNIGIPMTPFQGTLDRYRGPMAQNRISPAGSAHLAAAIELK